MDLVDFNAFAQERRGQERTLEALRMGLVGRPVFDPSGALLGRVEDVLVSPREKIPRHLVLQLPRRPWQRVGDERLYPLPALAHAEQGSLVATHSLSCVRRMLDFRRDFLAATGDADVLSLVEYLGAHGVER